MQAKLAKGLSLLCSLVLIASGARWLVDPQGAAAGLGMPLMEGVALSTQAGDIGALLFFSGLLAVIGVIKNTPSYCYSAGTLMGGVAIFRVLTTVTIGAALATTLIAVEVVFAVIFVWAGSQKQG